MESARPVVPSKTISNAPVVPPRYKVSAEPSALVLSIQGMFGVKPEDKDYNLRKYKEWQQVFSPNGKLNKEKCSFRRVLQHIYITEYFCIVDLPCGTWQCPSCGPGLKGKWEERMCVPMRASKHVEYVAIASSEWKAYQKKLERQKYPYIRIEDEKGQAHLLIGGEMGGEIITNPTDRMSKLRQLLQQMPFDRTAISISKEWSKASKASMPKKEKEWRVLGNTKDSLGIINSRVIRMERAEKSAEFLVPYEGTYSRPGCLYRITNKDEQEHRETLENLGLSNRDIEKDILDYRRRVKPEVFEEVAAS